MNAAGFPILSLITWLPLVGGVATSTGYTATATGTDYWVATYNGNSNNAGYPPPYTAAAVSGGGSYTNCADRAQPGVGQILDYLSSLPTPINPNCEPGHYYLLNNYNPGYFGNGNNAYVDHNPSNTPFTIPPSTVPSIGDSLIAASLRSLGPELGFQVGTHQDVARLQVPVDHLALVQMGYGQCHLAH